MSIFRLLLLLAARQRGLVHAARGAVVIFLGVDDAAKDAEIARYAAEHSIRKVVVVPGRLVNVVAG